MKMRFKAPILIALTVLSVALASVPHAVGTLYVDWSLNTTEAGEFITAFAHLYGVPRVEQAYDLYFCVVTLDATKANVPLSGIIEVSVGNYAQPARQLYEISKKDVYKYGLNPTFNDKVAAITTATPVTVDFKITDKSGSQLYADSKTIEMLPVDYYAWVIQKNDQQKYSVVLATPHADPVQKVISTAARATPWNAIVGYQEVGNYSHHEIVSAQMRAVYNVLQNLGITYVSTPTTFTSTQTQRVKLPVETLSDNAGNCIETALLFDSIFEAIGFDTYLIYTATHAFIGVGEWPDSDSFLPLETTNLGAGTYDQARDLGHDQFAKAKEDPSYYWLDVRKVRETGIAPTPYMDKMSGGEKFYQKIDEISGEITSARNTIEKVRDAERGMQSIPPTAEDLYRKAQSLFWDGKYRDAESSATQAMQMLASAVSTQTVLASTVSTQTAQGLLPTGLLPSGLLPGGGLQMNQQSILMVGVLVVIIIVFAIGIASRRRR